MSKPGWVRTIKNTSSKIIQGRNRKVCREERKELRDGEVLICRGREFQTHEAAYEKDLRAAADLILGTVSKH